MMNISRWLSRSRGFSLVEVVVAMLITMIMALATIGAIVFTRNSMELDKQRLSALNVARDYIEQAHAHINVSAATVPLVNFDTPTSTPDIMADVRVEYFPILANSNATIDWNNPVTLPDAARPFYCRVTVRWQPAGTWGSRKRQFVRIASIVRRGSL